jgi:hypothetical protein
VKDEILLLILFWSHHDILFIDAQLLVFPVDPHTFGQHVQIVGILFKQLNP